MSLSASGCLVAVCVLIVPTLANAHDGLDRTRSAIASLRFDEAIESAQRGVEAGTAQPEEIATLYRLWGEALAVVGEDAQARALFGRALQLAPATLLSTDAPPKVTRPFNAARADLQGRFLQMSVTSDWLSDGRVRTRVRVAGDVHGLVAQAYVQPVPFTERLPASHLPEGEVAWTCAQPPCGYVVELADSFGNVLQRAGDPALPLLVDRPAAAAPTEPLWKRPWPYLAVSAGLAVTSGVLGFEFARTQSALKQATLSRDQHAWAEVRALDEERRRLQVATVGTAAAAAGFGIAAAFVW